MSTTINYRTAVMVAIGLHMLLVLVLMMDNHQNNFVQKQGTQFKAAESSLTLDNKQEPIKAVAVDSQAVEETMNRIKSERARQKQAELNQQRAMEQKLRLATQARVREQENLVRLKKEAAELALKQEKKLAEEKKHMKELAQQKLQQEQHLAELKQQQLLIKKQAEDQQQKMALQQKKADDLARSKVQQAQQEKARLAQQAADQARAAATAAKNAQMAGVVNKYKALIIQSISQHWILPDHVDSQLYSQFRIRLAPNGVVLDVNLIRSSGDPVLDRSAQAAIYKASPLPVPSDHAMFDLFRDISLTVRAESARG